MKKLKVFMCVALFGAMSFGAFSAYDYYTMSADEKALLENVEALTGGRGGNYEDNCYHIICNVRCIGTSGTNWEWAITPNRTCPVCHGNHGN